MGVVLAVTGALASCEDDGGGGDSGDASAQASTPWYPLSERELKKAAVSGEDVEGFEISAGSAAEYELPGVARAKPSGCLALVRLSGAGKDPQPAATHFLTYVPDKGRDRSGGVLRLSAYEGRGAAKAIGEVRTAVRRCAKGYRGLPEDGTPQPVESVAAAKAPSLGDEAVAYRSTGRGLDGKSLETVTTVVRSGAHLSILTRADAPEAAKADALHALLAAQVKKVDAQVRAAVAG